MAKVAIVFHSGYGHTEVLARAIERGASSVQGVEATLVPVGEVESHWDALDRADAIVFGSPTYMGSASAKFKEFAEASSKRWMTMEWKDKLAAGFTNSLNLSGDKNNTLIELMTLASQHGMIWISSGQPVTSQDPDGLNRLGFNIGLGAQSDNAPTDLTPPSGDVQTAEAFGRRIGEAAKRWVREPVPA